MTATITPIDRRAAEQGMAWWNAITADDRAYWLRRAASARPVDAYRAYQNAVARCPATGGPSE